MLRTKIEELRTLLEDAAKADTIHKVEKLMEKYAKLLGIEGKIPKVLIRNNLGAEWLGRHLYKPLTPQDAVMEIQQSITGDDKTLERVVAHEMIHHAQAWALTDADKAAIRMGIRPQGHGKDFMEYAEKINKVMGAGFVTVTSDKEYVTAPSTKAFYVLILPIDGKLAWAWGAKISSKAKPWIEKKVANYKAKLVQTTEAEWTETTAKIKEFASFAIPSVAEKKERLEKLYKDAPAVQL
jgi:hypothetical protein